MPPMEARVKMLNPERYTGEHGFANDVLLRGDCSAYYTVPEGHEELCPKCRGKGLRLRRGVLPITCNGCKGMGYKVYAASAEKRAHTRDMAKARKAKKLDAAIAAFQVEYPAVWGWMVFSSQNTFGAKMQDALLKWGGLTDRQLSASIKCAGRRR